MPIRQTAHYEVAPEGVDDVRAAIAEFVRYVAQNEPRTTMYAAWQSVDEPTRFVHLFECADEAAHKAHGSSDAVRAFEDVYQPVLSAGPVQFTDYQLVARNSD
jgi:quinol monooxygenase YgiN